MHKSYNVQSKRHNNDTSKHFSELNQVLSRTLFLFEEFPGDEKFEDFQ